MQDFVINGYLVLRPKNLTDAFHQDVYDRLTAMIKNHGNPGNDLLDHAPCVNEVLADPEVTGALTSLVGANSVRDRHCACHNWGPGKDAQGWHKDYPIGGNMRYHRTRTLLLLYYPQEVSPGMGPTAVLPGTQYYMEPRPDLPGINLHVEAGTVVITHYEVWHRATANTSDRMRFMLKFLYNRTEEPREPTWDHTDPHWVPRENPLFPHRNLWQHMWHWYQGGKDDFPYAAGTPSLDEIEGLKSAEPVKRRRAADQLGLYGPAAQPAATALAAALTDADEVVRLNAAYALGSGAADGVPLLLEGLKKEAAEKWETNLQRGDFTNPSQLDLTFGLAAAGSTAAADGTAVPVLGAVLDHPDWYVRAAAIATLGCIGLNAGSASMDLIAALADPNEWVARNAAQALGNIPTPNGRVAGALAAALTDTRPVTAWSLGKDPLRENAASALAKWGDLPDELIAPLQTAQGEDSEYLRFWAQTALARRGN
ncbi:MAG: hypothetical protein HOB49_19895 [Gemmatimonadetes bacterium]|nr:hypothetical protein [Gemmatimonadota bacterium]MBT6629285.1 hypothetical protein [Gemmatimonadota bacterium]MBT7452798.1 hypothetical protein [Gemmatimonadota bacterium]